MDGEEPTQATQNILDPRRVGKQNSGFSDEDVSDIICVLYPHSDSARQEVQRLAQEDSPHIIGKDEADGVEPDYELEDHASRFESNPNAHAHGNYAIILRLSSQVKNPATGFAFGRNGARCDVVFLNDPLRRVSNIHFRIYVNEFGNVMIEDQSTNGTSVDRTLLTSHPKEATHKPPVTRWVLSSGSVIRIFLHTEMNDLTFRVRIPRRDDEYDRAYTRKVEEYFIKHFGTITPGPNGHVDLFGAPKQEPPRRTEVVEPPVARTRSPSRRRENHSIMRKEWTGSGKYNRIGMIGKGAFAVVYKVTSKYDGRPYAAKELEKRRFIKNGILDAKVENEMRIMKRVQHPNIVRYMENFDWDDRLLIIIMEFVPGGDLGKLIADDGPLDESTTKTMSQQLLSALGYLHENNITHRDVKPDNILINSVHPLEVKLTDFGLSKMVDTEQTFLRTFCGTLLYCAPEVYTEFAEYDDNGIRNRGKRARRIPGQRYNHAVDIWSLGGVLFYTLTGAPPYPVKSGISYSELLHKIMTSMLNILPLQNEGVSERGIDFLCRMLQRRPENRATVEELDNHPWLGGSVLTIKASQQSYDEITDEEDLIEPSQLQAYDDDRVSDSMGEESEKGNYGTQAPRLFGEVGVSAFASSGVIPETHLNLPAARASSGVLEHQPDEAYDSADSTATRVRHGNLSRQTSASVGHNQSADQLQSLVEDVASQSLGDCESRARNPGASIYSTGSIDFNASKRKPPSSLEASDEFEDGTPQGKPMIKRFKSDITMEDVSDQEIEEYKLLARMPQVKRQGSRQIDGPVSKIIYWEPDRRTWHLNYPEMTQLQRDAFVQAARDGREDFAPEKTPLWDLAMKYFPPMNSADRKNGRGLGANLRHDSRSPTSELVDFPPTAAPMSTDSIPDTLPPDSQIVVPLQANSASNRAVGMIDSDSESCISVISFPITDSLVSFGRGLENTQVFEPKTESRVPKYAFKIMLWKDGYDPSRDPAKTPHPWNRESSDSDSYFFYISTKATIGIKINGYVLPSSDAKNPNGPSTHWTKIYDGDSLLIWGGGDSRNQTKLVFRCFWGGSSKSRGSFQQLELAPPPAARGLDTACQRAEKRIRDVAERDRKRSEAEAEHLERSRHIEWERARSRIFEEKRAEAVKFLSSRRNSPTSVPPSVQSGRFQTTTQMGRSSSS
ncbi:Serine/threonine-protein kinase RAD53 [Cladobotryum mycophilum]|uniref:Autophagy-related protein 1 n=1 Tax=Cladobotryum mycophilum TaxID=491253 RepID=A0ABR0SF16_9HYPO